MSSEQAVPGDIAVNRQIALLCRLMCGFALILMGVTFRLWWTGNPLPAIPWIAAATNCPAIVSQSLTVGLLLSLLAGLLLPEHWCPLRLRMATIAWLWGMCLLLDQNRLQPWAWEFWLIAAVIALCQPRDTIRILRGLIIAIYIYSAASKFDAAFLEGLGPLLWTGLLNPAGIEPSRWPPGQQMFAAALLPIGELVVAGLLMSRWRRWGLWLSISQHLLLIVALGPFGLRHEWGVLLWNVYFIIQNVLLFGNRPSDAAITPMRPLSRVILLLLVLYPALEWFGLCDPWPAWAVYCHRPIRIWPLVHVDDVEKLPPALRACVDPPAPLSDWSTINLDTWSFREVHAPLYPEGRYRAALFLAAIESSGIEDDHLGLDAQYPSLRWTNAREKTRLLGKNVVDHWARERWANTKPGLH